MSERIARKNLKRKPKPVPTGKVKRCKDLNSVSGHHSQNEKISEITKGESFEILEKTDSFFKSLTGEFTALVTSTVTSGDTIINPSTISTSTITNENHQEKDKEISQNNSSLLVGGVAKDLTSMKEIDVTNNQVNISKIKNNYSNYKNQISLSYNEEAGVNSASRVMSNVHNINLYLTESNKITESNDTFISEQGKFVSGSLSVCSHILNQEESNQVDIHYESTMNKNKKSFALMNKKELAILRSNAYNGVEVDTSKLTLRDFIYFNPPHNPMKGVSYQDEEESSDDNYEQIEFGTNLVTPQVKIAVDGKTVVDPKSLIVKPSINNGKKQDMSKSKIIKEDEFTNRFKSKQKSKQKEGKKFSLLNFEDQPKSRLWTPEETLKFYKVLNDFGSDFSYMSDAFPYRNRRQIKRKFQTEEKIRVKYIDLAMKERDSIDFDELEKELNKTRLKREAQRKRKERVIEKDKESKRLLKLEIEKLFKGKKKKANCFEALDMGAKRVGRKYDDKVKRMTMCIKRLRLKYLEETGKNKKIEKRSSKNSKKNFDDHIENESNAMFDLTIPFSQDMLFPKQEEIFVHDIKCKHDLDLFIWLTSSMFCYLGKDWKEWAKKIVIDQLLKREDCEAKNIAIGMKADIDENERKERLEMSYQLFSNPFDYTDPFNEVIESFEIN